MGVVELQSHLSLHEWLSHTALSQFGAPERITAFVTSGRDASHDVEDDFLVHLHYAPGAPLPPDHIAPPPGTRLGGLRVTLGASCMASRTDNEQCRWAVCGTRGSVSASFPLDSCIQRAHILSLCTRDSTRSVAWTHKRTSSRQVSHPRTPSLAPTRPATVLRSSLVV